MKKVSDFIQLNGIGQKTALLLAEKGINTPRKLSRFDAARLKNLTGLSKNKCETLISEAKAFINPNLRKNSVDDDWVKAELEDFFDEELELEMDDYRIPSGLENLIDKNRKTTLDRRTYFKTLLELQMELVKV